MGCQRLECFKQFRRYLCATVITHYIGQLIIINDGKLIFSQVMEFIPWHTFRRCVKRYDGEYKLVSFRCTEQYRCMAFATAYITVKACATLKSVYVLFPVVPYSYVKMSV